MARILAYSLEALESIARNALRSSLSVLGMVIGIASVIAVLGLSQAAANGMQQEIASGGNPGFIAMVDQSSNDPAAGTLSYRDVDRFLAYTQGGVARAVPIVQRPVQVTVPGKTITLTAQSVSINDDSGITPIAGRLISQQDVDTAAPVCMLMDSTAKTLFGSAAAAAGRTLNVANQRLTVAGVFHVKGSLMVSMVGDTLYVPYTTMHLLEPGSVDFIQFWPANGAIGSVQLIDMAKAALKRIHPQGKYVVQDQSAVIGVFGKILNTMGVGLTAIGGIALLVAGVGIMNIMLVTVAERTREIGLRKSIGANAGDITLQFLIEAAALSLGGGLLGTAIGVGVVLLGRTIILQTVGAAPVPWGLVIGIAVGFSVVIGIVFGLFPAARAGRLDPVEALRS